MLHHHQHLNGNSSNNNSSSSILPSHCAKNNESSSLASSSSNDLLDREILWHKRNETKRIMQQTTSFDPLKPFFKVALYSKQAVLCLNQQNDSRVNLGFLVITSHQSFSKLPYYRSIVRHVWATWQSSSHRQFSLLVTTHMCVGSEVPHFHIT